MCVVAPGVRRVSSPVVKPAETATPPSAFVDEQFRLLVNNVRDYAFVMLDPQGIVTGWNAGAERIKGYAAHEIIGRSFETFYPPEVAAAGWPSEELRRAAEDGHFEDEGWRVRGDGSRFWANVVITALRDEAGVLRGFGKVTRDLTERRRHEEALRESEERSRLLVEGITGLAVFMLDTEGRVASWNPGAARIKGYETAEVLGRHFSMFYTPEAQAAGEPQRHLARALATGRAEHEGLRVRGDGSMFWADIVITPVYDGEHRLRGYAKVTRDVSERRRVAELERSSQRMSEFIAMLAHELRNPLSPIRNAVSIMQLEPALTPRVARCSEIIDRQLGTLTRLVDDLLDAGRITSGKIALRRETLDFAEVVQRAAEAALPLMEARRHHFAIQLPEGPIPVWGDDTRLVQALQNLLNNAARYTADGGTIELRVRTAGGQVVATVSDNGRGIEAAALESIFELFTQEDSAPRGGDGGLGIGLSLARRLVELHGGSLAAESGGPGLGSTFTLRLPRGLVSGPALPPEPPPPEAPVGQRTLVIDDNRDSADTMVALLQLLGHEARCAYDVDEAVRAAQAFAPDVVFLDLNLPQVDGFEVLRRLRRLPGLETVFAAAITGYGQQSDRDRTHAAGFDAHLTKPVGVEQLLGVLQQAKDRAERG
jgi:PAS domain S-box-containing protein